MSVGPLLLLAVLALSGSLLAGARLSRLWLGLNLAGSGAALGAAILALAFPSGWEWRSGFLVGGERLHLRMDGLSALFVILLCVVSAASAVYARQYWSDEHHPDSAPRGRIWASAMFLSMLSLLLASNGLHFLIVWELFSVSSFFLITLDRERSEVRASGWLFLAASHAGTLCLFAFFATLAARTGSWDLGPMRDQPALAPLFWLALCGFSVKAGLFPVHIWLPSAHANAPSHVSALMSGVAIKMGVYGLMRFSGWMPLPAAAGWVVITLGAVTAFLGIAYAFAQDDLKRLLTYCSVENVGIVVVGLGGALLGATHANAPWGRILMAGALFHVLNHGLYKALLFLSAGSVLHATGTKEMSRLGGLWRAMPWTASLFAFGAVAIAGLPPLNGFVSEWLIYLGLLDAATDHIPSVWVTIPAAILLATAGALALATFVKAAAVTFLGAPRTEAALQAHESGPLMRGPMVALASLCLLIGLSPMILWPAVSRGVEAWNPGWICGEPPVPLATLGRVQLGLLAVFAAAAFGLWRRVSANGLRRAMTWDCGFSAPTSRMQYTSGSFSGIAAGWFSWVFRPELTQRRPHGPFPSAARRIQRTPETMLERVLEPVAGLVALVARAARQLQHGRLQFYIVYLFAGLTVLAMIALAGGAG